MKPLALPKKEESEKPSTQLVDIKTARQIALEAVEEANKTSFQKFQEFYKQQNQPPTEETVEGRGQGTEYEEPADDLMNFDKKAFRSVSNTLKTIQAMKQAFETPASPVETAVSTVVERVSLNLAERLMGGIGSSGQSAPIGRSSFILDLLNTQAAASFGHAFGENITSVVQALTNSLGAQKTQELVDNVNRKISGESTALPEGNPEVEKQKDMVLQLDSNNPVHVSQYAQAMGLSEKAAKEMLVVHQNDIRTERQGASSGNVGSSNGNSEILNVLNIMAQELSGMKQTVVSLQSELDSIKGKKKTKQEDLELESAVDTDDRWNEEIPRNQSINIEKREVNLFSQPVKVDIDEIAKGSNLKDSFFENPSPVTPKELPKETPKESVLEEVKDKDGNSTFKMSGEQEVEELEEESDVIETPEPESIEVEVKETVKEVSKEELKDQSKEADIKKENEKVEVNETSTQDTKKPIRRVIRKIIKPSEVPLKQEFYDINNNLIN